MLLIKMKNKKKLELSLLRVSLFSHAYDNQTNYDNNNSVNSS